MVAMVRWITILGGVLIMIGQHNRWEALFDYFRLQDQAPETHLLRRLIEQHITKNTSIDNHNRDNHNRISVSIQFPL
jgi:hypothetical protein